MRVIHVSKYNGSGMHHVAASMVAAERAEGIDAHLINLDDGDDAWASFMDGDIYMPHTHMPDGLDRALRRAGRPPKIVWIAHGTPEYMFQQSVEDGTHGHYGFSDALMLFQHWMRVSDARVTFWPRHQAIMQTMAQRGTTIHCVPMGIDHSFWVNGVSGGKYAGNPSVWSSENSQYIKWAYDLVTLWPWVYPELEGASLHLNYLPRDQHRWFAPWLNANGAGYGMHWSDRVFQAAELRNIFKSIDFFIGLVRYGDFNRLSHEANVAGVKTISYVGNPHSDFWVPEGDQRIIAKELVRIFKGEVEPRQKQPVPDISETAIAMKAIYEGVLGRKDAPKPSTKGSKASALKPIMPAHVRQAHAAIVARSRSRAVVESPAAAPTKAAKPTTRAKRKTRR